MDDDFVPFGFNTNMDEAPHDQTWIVLFTMYEGEPQLSAGFWSDEGCTGHWYASEAASREIGFEPTAWKALN